MKLPASPIRASCALACAFLFALGGGAPRAETIVLEGGRELEGVVSERRDGQIVVLTKGGRLVLPESKVVRIIEERPGAGEAKRLALFLASGRFDEALEAIDAILAKADALPPEGLADILDALSAEGEFIGKALSRLPPTLARRALEMFARLLEAAEASPLASEGPRWSAQKFRVSLARWHWLAGSAELAPPLLESVGPDFYDARPKFAARASSQLIDAVWDALRRRELPRGERLLEALRSADGNAWRAASAMFFIEAGSIYRQSGDFARALATYRDKLAPFAPRLAEAHMEQALGLAERTLRTTNEWKTLLELLEEYAPLVHEPETANDLVEAALEDAGMQAISQGNSRAALGYFQRLASLRGEGDERLFGLAELARRRADTRSDDWVGRYEIGLYCLERGLLDEAAAEFLALRESPLEELRVEAARQLDLIELQREVDLYARVDAASEAGRYYDTLDLAMEFLKRYPSGDLSGDVSRLGALAREEIANAQLRRPYAAEVLYQQAERAFFLQETEESLAMLDDILSEYAETPAAERAARLKEQVAGRYYASDLEKYLRSRRTSLDVLAETLPLSETESDKARELREEVAFIARTIGSRLPDYSPAPSADAPASSR